MAAMAATAAVVVVAVEKAAVTVDYLSTAAAEYQCHQQDYLPTNSS
jgi:hypothetical protein